MEDVPISNYSTYQIMFPFFGRRDSLKYLIFEGISIHVHGDTSSLSGKLTLMYKLLQFSFIVLDNDIDILTYA